MKQHLTDWLTGMAFAAVLGFAFLPDCVFAQEAPPPGVEVQITGSTTLRWQAPTENVDGTPYDDPGGFKIYWGQQSRSYTGSLDVDDTAATNWGFSVPLDSVDDIEWYFAMTAVDSEGNESAYSNEVLKRLEVTWTYINPPPAAPVLIEVEMNLTCTTDSQWWTCEVTATTVP